MNPDPKPLLTTLPGDIPRLLRNGSILRHNGRRAVALQVIEGFVLVAHHAPGTDEEIEIEGGTVPWGLVALDLTDPTGRWHAAVWAEQATTYADVMEALRQTEHAFYVDAIDAICRAKAARTMTPTQIDALARLVLCLAGRAP